MTVVTRTERGWPGHFIVANRCLFRRNTLLSTGDTKIVVSTVGLLVVDGKIETIGHNRYYETMAFHSKSDDLRYFDADVYRDVEFESEWSIDHTDADDKANEMHEAVVSEISRKLSEGLKF